MRSFDRHLRPLLVCCTFSGALLLSSLAAASGASPIDATAVQKKQAMDHFTAGKKAIEAKNWEEAAFELRASLDVVDSPNARLELARTLRDSGKLGEAWTEYGHVVDQATKLAAKEDRYTKTADAASTERGEIEPKLAFVTVTVAHAPADAALKVGGRAVPAEQWSAPIVVSPGAIDVVLSDASGKELARQTVPASVGEKMPVALDAQPPPPPAPTGKAAADTGDDDKPGSAKPPVDLPPPTSPSDKSKLRPYAYVAGGVGVVGLGLFTAFGLMSNSTYSDLQGACPHGCPPGKQGEIDSGRTQQTVANVGLVVGIVGVAAGATLFVLSMPSKSSSPTTGLVVAPGYLGVRGSL
ncbi:MAG TPA: tetratricopeptide repeat protein [Polyangiaceae bacterium]|jgi:hypothetical protein